MLLIFRSKASASIFMLSAHAAPLLRAAGKSFTETLPEQGVFRPDQLPHAIAGIKHAIAHATDVTQEEDPEEDETAWHHDFRSVTLQQRAYPLLHLMQESYANNAYLTWEPASSLLHIATLK